MGRAEDRRRARLQAVAWSSSQRAHGLCRCLSQRDSSGVRSGWSRLLWRSKLPLHTNNKPPTLVGLDFGEFGMFEPNIGALAGGRILHCPEASHLPDGRYGSTGIRIPPAESLSGLRLPKMRSGVREVDALLHARTSGSLWIFADLLADANAHRKPFDVGLASQMRRVCEFFCK
jgi:hypothetical protein